MEMSLAYYWPAEKGTYFAAEHMVFWLSFKLFKLKDELIML